MITRAQAEALLQLAEALEACERQGAKLQIDAFGSKPKLLIRLHNAGFECLVDQFGHMAGPYLRCAVAEYLPRSERNDNCRGLGVDHRPIKSDFSDCMFCSKCGDELPKHTGS